MSVRKIKDIRDVINEIGEEVDDVLERNVVDRYFQNIMLLYSLIENFLKWMVATKTLWDETGVQVEAARSGSLFEVDFEEIRVKSERLSMYRVIEEARNRGLVGIRLQARLHRIREKRNDFVHELWIIRKRKKPEVLRRELEYLAGTAHKLIYVFDRLVNDEIGLDFPELYTWMGRSGKGPQIA
jgi:hypothetical protein